MNITQLQTYQNMVAHLGCHAVKESFKQPNCPVGRQVDVPVDRTTITHPLHKSYMWQKKGTHNLAKHHENHICVVQLHNYVLVCVDMSHKI